MTALRAIAQDVATHTEIISSDAEYANPLFKRAVDAVFALDERGYRLDLSVQDQPYEALLKISQSLHEFGISHNVANEFVEAIEAQAVHVGVDFTKKAKPTPMEISLYIMDKEPELSDDQDHYIVAWDGLQKFGGDYNTDTVVEMHIDGTRSTRSNVPKFEDMFKIGSKKYLTVHLKKLKQSGGQTLDETGAELANFVEAVGPVAAGSAGGGAMKAQIENGTISPAMKELIGTVAETKHVIETAKFEAPSDKNALKIVDLNNKIVAQTHQVAAVEPIPSVVAKAVSKVMDQGAAVVQPVKASIDAGSSPKNAAPIIAMNENVAANLAAASPAVAAAAPKAAMEGTAPASPSADAQKPKATESAVTEKAAVTTIKMGDVVAIIPAAVADVKAQASETNVSASSQKSSPVVATVAATNQLAPDGVKAAVQNVQPAKMEKPSVVPVANNQNTAPAVQQAEAGAKAPATPKPVAGAAVAPKQAEAKAPAVAAQQGAKTVEGVSAPSANNQNAAPAVKQTETSAKPSAPAKPAETTAVASKQAEAKAPAVAAQQSVKTVEGVSAPFANNQNAAPVVKQAEASAKPSATPKPAETAVATPKQGETKAPIVTAQQTVKTVDGANPPSANNQNNAPATAKSVDNTAKAQPAQPPSKNDAVQAASAVAATKPIDAVKQPPSSNPPATAPQTLDTSKPAVATNTAAPAVPVAKAVDPAKPAVPVNTPNPVKPSDTGLRQTQPGQTTAPVQKIADAPKPATSGNPAPQTPQGVKSAEAAKPANPVVTASSAKVAEAGTQAPQIQQSQTAPAVKQGDNGRAATVNPVTPATTPVTPPPKPAEASDRKPPTVPVQNGSDISKGAGPSVQTTPQPATMATKPAEGPKPPVATNTGTSPALTSAAPPQPKAAEPFRATAGAPSAIAPVVSPKANETPVKTQAPVSPVTVATGLKAADPVSTPVQIAPSTLPSRGAEPIKTPTPPAPPINQSAPKPVDLAAKATPQPTSPPVQTRLEAFRTAPASTATPFSIGTGRPPEPSRGVSPPPQQPKMPEPPKYTAPPVAPPSQTSPRPAPVQPPSNSGPGQRQPDTRPPVPAPPRVPETRTATPPLSTPQGVAGRNPVQDPKPVPPSKPEYKAPEVKTVNPVNNGTGTFKQNSAPKDQFPTRRESTNHSPVSNSRPAAPPKEMPIIHVTNHRALENDLSKLGDNAKRIMNDVSSGKIRHEDLSARIAGLSPSEKPAVINAINLHTETRFASEPSREFVLDRGFKGGGGYKPDRVIAETRIETVVANPVKERTLYGDDRKDAPEQKLSKIFEEKCKGCGGEKRCPACPSNSSALNLKR